MNSLVEKNKYGFYEVINKPSEKELNEYYSKKYYQNNAGSYEKQYTKEEIEYFNNKIEEKYFVINKLLKLLSNSTFSILDIGCGEGWTLNYFNEKKWDITGIDFSDSGCKNHNPHLLENLIIGDIYENISKLINSKKYDVVWLDNVLEHVFNPKDLLEKCRKLINKNGILIIEVPNDFSVLQNYLISNKLIDKQFWIALPDHLSYFNKEGLNNLANDAGWVSKFIMSDSPIDFNLLNEHTNYINDKSKGKSCHYARVKIDNLIHSISVENAVNYYNSLAELGLGRQLISFYQPK
ncbi:MAG: hypothetical protein A2033_10565 [Bacteroidetes bacterium GWA2_31_9]|nr:MAG: hypothetical protein A2033_10565 [Bacteroidetes bacterium GWA2_31_9]